MTVLANAMWGSRAYRWWMAALASAVAAGVLLWWRQWEQGLALTGMSRDVAWGLYIGQFTFFVGVAASAVTVVLPDYLHGWKAFGLVVILGELLAIASVVVAMLFVFVDLGRPDRLLNVMLHPSPSSLMFWDLLALAGYLGLNVILARAARAAAGRDRRCAARRLGARPRPDFHPVGGFHPHRHRLSLCGAGGPAVLADGGHGAAIPGFRVRRWSRAADPALPRVRLRRR